MPDEPRFITFLHIEKKVFNEIAQRAPLNYTTLSNRDPFDISAIAFDDFKAVYDRHTYNKDWIGIAVLGTDWVDLEREFEKNKEQ